MDGQVRGRPRPMQGHQPLEGCCSLPTHWGPSLPGCLEPQAAQLAQAHLPVPLWEESRQPWPAGHTSSVSEGLARGWRAGPPAWWPLAGIACSLQKAHSAGQGLGKGRDWFYLKGCVINKAETK